MKRIFGAVLSLILILVNCPAVYAESDSNILQYEDSYEDYKSTEELFASYSVQDSYSRTRISIEKSDEIHGKSLKLGLTPEGDNTQVFYNPPSPVKSGRVEMKFSVNITDKLIGHIYCTDSETGDLFSLLYFDGSEIRVGTNMDVPADWSGSGVELCNYLTNNWYTFEIVLDVDNNYYNVKCITPDSEEYTFFYRGVKRMFKDMGTNDYGETEGFGKLAFQVWTHREGYMYVDDVSVKQLPYNVIDVRTARDGNIFYANDDKSFDIDIKNCSDEKLGADVTYSAVTDSGVELFSSSEKLSADGGETISKELKLDMDIFDTAMLNITFDDKINEPYTESFPFSCVITDESSAGNDFFGMCSHDTRDGTDGMEERADMYKAFGINYVREDFEWKSIEINGVLKLPDHYIPFIKNLYDRGIKVLPILAFGNDAYDEGGLPYTKEGVAAFVRYAEFMYDQLSPYGVDTFEVWNEADLKGTGFNPTSRPAEDYRELLKATSKALKAKNPNVKIIGGAISSTNDEEWLKTVFDEGGLQAMDILQLHPYQHEGGPEATDIVGKINKIRNIMIDYGNPAPIWLTELGWYNIGRIGTSSDSLVHTKYEQAAYPVRAHILLQADGAVEKYFYYNMINPLANQNFTEGEFGLMEAEKGTLVPRAAKPSLLAISAMNSMLAGLSMEQLYQPDDKTYIGKYRSKDTYRYVAWNIDGKKSIGIKSDKTFDVYDMYGNFKGTLYPVNGVINVMLSDEPCYLVTQEQNIETAECTVTIDNISAQAVFNDKVKYNITADSSEEISVKAEVGKGGRVEAVTAAKGAASYEVATDNDTDVNLIGVCTEVYEGDKLVYYAESEIELKHEQFDVSMRAEPYNFSNLNRWNVVVTVHNNSFSKKSGGTVTLNAPENMAQYSHSVKIRELDSGETESVKIALPEIIKKNIEAGIITVTDDEGNAKILSDSLSFYVASYAKNKPVIDGKLSNSEWKGTWIMLDRNSWSADTSGTVAEAYTGTKDLNAKVNIMWDTDNLYLCADVYDNKHIQPYTDEEINNGDSIIFAVDDTNSVSNTQFTEIGCALTSNGTELFRWRSMAENNDVNEGSIAKAVHYENNHTIYEISIPWAGLISKPETITERDVIGLAMMINDCDRTGRKGRLEFTGGISGYKDASMFADILLEKP